MMTETQTNGERLRALLPQGSIKTLAKRTGKSRQAVHKALTKCDPTSDIVKEALRMVDDAGTARTAAALASLPTTSPNPPSNQ